MATHPNNQQVLVIDGASAYREIVVDVLTNMRYASREFADLNDARQHLEALTQSHRRPCGMCVDMSFGRGEFIDEVARKWPPISSFLHLIQNQYSEVPIVLFAQDEEGVRSALDLAQQGLRVAVVDKRGDAFVKEVSMAAASLFAQNGTDIAIPTWEGPKGLQIIAMLLLVLSYPIVIFSTSFALRHFGGAEQFGMVATFGTISGFGFSLLCIGLLRLANMLPPRLFRDCFVAVLKYIRLWVSSCKKPKQPPKNSPR